MLLPRLSMTGGRTGRTERERLVREEGSYITSHLHIHFLLPRIFHTCIIRYRRRVASRRVAPMHAMQMTTVCNILQDVLRPPSEGSSRLASRPLPDLAPQSSVRALIRQLVAQLSSIHDADAGHRRPASLTSSHSVPSQGSTSPTRTPHLPRRLRHPRTSPD